MAGGAIVLALPVGFWWYNARQERAKVDEQIRTKIRLPGGYSASSTDEEMIEKYCQAGDVLVFDRRCETCATSPWAALACFASRQFLCDNVESKHDRHFNHVGLIVPGYINSRHDAHDATNLLLLEATPSHGIVARPLLSRLEHSQARSIWLLQLACPGERRITTVSGDESNSPQQQSKSVREARHHLERQLIQFRDQWIEASRQLNYAYMHSTLGLGGALAYQTGLLRPDSINSNRAMGSRPMYQGPVSPSAWLCFMGLQCTNAAHRIHDAHRQLVRVQDFVNVSSRFSSLASSTNSEDVLRLRPGWRFLAPIPFRENNAPQS
jgi:hypothetical protein